jgi:hypothetical protein
MEKCTHWLLLQKIDEVGLCDIKPLQLCSTWRNNRTGVVLFPKGLIDFLC